jgi:hypothetical protein
LAFADNRSSARRSCGASKAGEGTAFRRLHTDRVDAGRLGIFAHPVEQDGLADTPQSDHQDALRGTARSQAFAHRPDDVAQFVAPGQLRGGVPAPGSNGLRTGSIDQL